ncbi:MAG: peptidoglycan-binding protein [Clostridia bacterium]
MKKNLVLVLMALLLVTVGAGALAESVPVYIGPGDRIYELGMDEALSGEMASEIFTATDLSVLFSTDLETDAQEDREAALYLLDRSGDEAVSEEISSDSHFATWDEQAGVLYFVESQALDTLMSYDPTLHEVKTVVRADQPIERLALSTDGLLVYTAAGARLLIPVVGQLVEPLYQAEGQVFVDDGYEAILSSDGQLSLRYRSGKEAKVIAQDVLACAPHSQVVFYLQGKPGRPSTLMAYMQDVDSTAAFTTFAQAMTPQLRLSEGNLYLMDQDGNVYQYAILSGEVRNVASVQGMEPVLRVNGGIVTVRDAGMAMGERFLTLVADSDSEEAVAQPTTAPTAAPTAKTTAKPEEITLSRGDRGDEVKKFQLALIDLGYLDGKADGVFGAGMQTAITYLQSDLGYRETGKADAKLRRLVYAGKAPDFSKYVSLSKGDEGIRVSDLQTRLRTLCYMAESAGGHYREKTVSAVKRFQGQLGEKKTGNITAKQMKALYHKNCAPCTDYFDLQKGDSAPAVKRLNKRLKALHYLTGSAGESYGKSTAKAIEQFQTQNGLRVVPGCDANLQYMIFDKNARPSVDPDPTPAPSWTAPTAKQLKVMRTWMNKHFDEKWGDKKVANRLQAQLSDRGYLEYNYQTGRYDKATYGAVRAFQTSEMVGGKATGIADKATLKALFD